MPSFLSSSAVTCHELGDGHAFFAGMLPADLVWTAATFDAVWNLHPAERHWVTIMGKPVQTPRWQQAYGANYQYTGSVNNAQPVPRILRPILEWAQHEIDNRPNGLLLNWYDGQNDYIGPHKDSTRNLVVGAPIITVSFGEERIFRLTTGKGVAKAARDFPAVNGAVFVLPFVTNKVWKHAVPKSARYRGRRISVTLRAFTSGVLAPEHYWE